MSITRRIFLRNSALAVVGRRRCRVSHAPAFGAFDAGTRNKRLVVISAGPADGLNIVVLMPNRSTTRCGPASTSAQVGARSQRLLRLHRRCRHFQPLWQQGHLAIVHAAGCRTPRASHFDAQDFMESAPGVKATDDGWLNRSLRTCRRSAKFSVSRDCAGASLPRILSGSEPASP